MKAALIKFLIGTELLLKAGRLVEKETVGVAQT